MTVVLAAKAATGDCPRWHAGEERLYSVDLPNNELHRLAPITGLGKVRIFAAPVGCFAFAKGGGFVMGMKDGRVVRLSPEGEIVESVELPVPRPTMIAFGGADRRTAYIMTARSGLDADALQAAPLSGAILSFRVDVPGMPEWDFG